MSTPTRPHRQPPTRPRRDIADVTAIPRDNEPDPHLLPAARAVSRRPEPHTPPATQRSTLRVYGARHAQAALASLGNLWRYRFGHALTMAAIAIALCLPAGLGLVVHRAMALVDQWSSAARISVFLSLDAAPEAANALAQQISSYPNVKTVSYISPEQALQDYRTQTGLSGLEESLGGNNPLPGLLIVEPSPLLDAQSAQIEALAQQLGTLPEVAQVQLDSTWLQRLFAILNVARTATWIVGGLLAAGVLLVIGNAIRLEIFNRREEIVISKLIGATNAYIRRPYLYTGLWYGLGGGLGAWLLLLASQQLLAAPLSQLASLYHTQLNLTDALLISLGPLAATGIMLGLVGAWISVARHLRDIEPG
jgi:cell division transport system permease protein